MRGIQSLELKIMLMFSRNLQTSYFEITVAATHTACIYFQKFCFCPRILEFHVSLAIGPNSNPKLLVFVTKTSVKNSFLYKHIIEFRTLQVFSLLYNAWKHYDYCLIRYGATIKLLHRKTVWEINLRHYFLSWLRYCRYKPEGRGFDSRWGCWDYSLT